MKKFTLFLVAAVMAVASFAQVGNMKLNQKDVRTMQTVTPDATKLTVEQKKAVVKTPAGKPVTVAPRAKAVSQAKNMAVKQQMDNARTIVMQKSVNSKSSTALSEGKYSIRAKAGKTPARKDAVKADDGKTPVTPPAGLQTETYVCAGVSYVDMGSVSYNVEVGFDGNDVYVQGLLRNIPTGWIKGTLADGKVTFEKGQYLGDAEVFDYYTGESLGFFPATLVYQDGMTGSETDLVLTYNAETGVLNDLAEGALFFDDGNDGMIDVLMGIMLTPQSAFGDVSYDLVTPPATAQMSAVDLSYQSFALNKQITAVGYMAIDGNDIYVQGLMNDMPSAWIKGTKAADGIVTFEKGQYLGKYAGQMDMWLLGLDPADLSMTLIDVLAQWNEEEQSLTFAENTWLVENADPISLYFADVFYDVTVYPLSGDREVVVPPAGLEARLHDAKVVSIGTLQGMYTYGNSTYPVSIGFDGEDAYMQGLFYYAPNAWIKGKHNADGSITFANNQYLGTVRGYDAYVVACNDDEEILENYTFTYDAEKDTYYYNEYNTNISFSTEPNSTNALDIIYNVELAGPDAQKINTNVIWEQPEGDLKIYSRNGDAYYVFWGYLLYSEQSGTPMKIVTNGNDVYMENPISQGQVEGGTWIKGTIEGNKIHMPLRQCVFYNEEEEWGYMTGIFKQEMVYDEYMEDYIESYVMTDDQEITFTIDEAAGTITMDLQSEVNPETRLADYIYGLAYTYNEEWAQVGDCNSVYTLLTDVPTILPDGAKSEQWALMYNDGDYNSAVMTNVAIAGDKMFIAGISEADPDAAIVGTIADGKVTFKSDQYQGMNTGYLAYVTFAKFTVEELYDEYYDEYYYDYSYDAIPEYTFNYDAEKKLLTPTADDVVMILNAGKGSDAILFINRFFKPEFNYFEEVAAKPVNPVINGLSEYFEDYGYDIFSGDVLLKDINGKYINKEKVYYILWTKVEGEAEPFTFYSDEYTGLYDALGVDEITEMPYSAVLYDEYDYEDVTEGASYIIIYQTGFDDYGLQTVYYGGGERNNSDIVWLSEATAIRDINADSKTATTAIYNLLGQRVNATAKGVIIKNGKKFFVK